MVETKPEPSAAPAVRRWWVAPLIVGVLYALLPRLLVDWPAIYEIDPDEGYNLIKALLLEQGHGFLSEIWSDQPPLYSYILWGALRAFGFEVWVGRAVTLVFAGVLLAALFDTLRRSHGVLAGTAAVCLLVVSQRFVRYSVAVMLGLPSLALLAVALWAIVVWSERRRPLALAGSGVALGLSLSIKAFTAFGAPIMIGLVLLALRRTGRFDHRAIARQAALLLVPLCLTILLAYLPALTSGAAGQLFGAHSRAAALPHTFGHKLLGFVWDDLLLVGLAAVGGILALRRRALAGLGYTGWFAAALVLLAFHNPVWHHHATLLTIPAAALAGIALDGGYRLLRHEGWSRAHGSAAVAIGIAVAVCWTLVARPIRIHELQALRRRGSDAADQRAHAALVRHAGPERTLVTARQMFAFRTGARVPPWLGVTSAKRFKAGLLDAEQIVAQIREHRVEQVLINSRWSDFTRKRIRQAIARDYRLVFRDRTNRDLELFVRADLLGR